MPKRKPNQTKVKLGDRARDKITGFAGIVVGYAQHLTGCDTVGLKPEELKDGKTINCHWFDLSEIEVLKEGAIELNQEIKFDTTDDEEVVEPSTKKKRPRDTGGPTTEVPNGTLG